MRFAVVCLLSLLPALALANPRLWIGYGNDVVKNEFLVTLKHRAGPEVAQDLKNQAKSLGIEVIREHKVGKRRFLHVKAESSIVGGLLANPYIDMVESNTLIHLEKPVEETLKVVEEVSVAGSIPQTNIRSKGNCHYDYIGPTGWGLIRISHRDKPDYETQPYIWGDGDDGEGVDIYIIDSGIRLNHTDYEGRAIWGTTGLGSAATDGVDDDLNGHGSHVAGTAGGRRFGIARKATLIAMKVLNRAGSGTVSDTIYMMEFIVNRMQQQRAEGKTPRAVANQSYGGTASNGSYAREASMQEAADEGLVGAASAGNNGWDSCRNSPTRVSSYFSVMASEKEDTLASFSNYGPCADIAAPGRLIAAPGIASTTQYVYKSGTSMASPHVAGIAARYLSSLPEEEMKILTSQMARARITKVTSRNKLDMDTAGKQAGPNHLLYRSCENPDEVEATSPWTPREPLTTTTTTTPGTTTSTTQSANQGQEAVSDPLKWTSEEIGPIVTGAFGVSAGIVGVSFGIMAFVHVLIHRLS